MTDTIIEPKVEMTAGEMLRNARTTGRRKREIPTIAKQLCIREEFLEALENGNYTFIPEVVYILGFARNYAMELGLNPDEIVAKIKREMGLISECQSSDDVAGVSACTIPDSLKKKLGFVMRAQRFVVRRWKLFAAAAALVVVLVIAAVMIFGGSAENNSGEKTVVAAPVVSTEPAYGMAVRERFGTENKDSANVILQANQNAGDIGTWVRIEDGRGNTVFSRVLVPGDVYYVPAGDKYKGTFGNAGGIDVWVNGKRAPTIKADRTQKVSMAPGSLMSAE